MLARSFLLALLALGFAAPAARRAATLGDLFVPDYDAADGVTVGGRVDRIPYMHFGPEGGEALEHDRRSAGDRRLRHGHAEGSGRRARRRPASAHPRLKLPKQRTRVFLSTAPAAPSSASSPRDAPQERTRSVHPDVGPGRQVLHPCPGRAERLRAGLPRREEARDRALRWCRCTSARDRDERSPDEGVPRPLRVAAPGPGRRSRPRARSATGRRARTPCTRACSPTASARSSACAPGVYSTNLEDLMGPREDAFSIF